MNYGAEMSYGATGTEDAIVAPKEAVPVSALQQMAAERLAAHRSRKAQAQAQAERAARREIQTAASVGQSSRMGAARVREAVAARYESSVSYREFLASETERALEQVQAAAESAARGAQAVAEAQMLIEELEQWNRTERVAETAEQEAMLETEMMFAPQLQVRLPEDLRTANSIFESTSVFRDDAMPVSEEELAGLEQEIEFRLSPDFVGHSLETQPIPANIIEFPRQLVAPRKARPRLAEGPLRDESEPEAQLRIFEVEAEQISMEAAVADPMEAAPEWQSLQLGAAPVENSAATIPIEFAIEPQTAALHLRMMAALVDGCLMMAAFLGFACVAMRMAGPELRALPLPLMGASAAATLTAIFLLYQMLFFTLADSTPGMRYARIGLCTFGDSNPTRKAMRRRVWAQLLAACPLGLGVVWMALDGEGLGWHDRMTRMYPRAY
jgi:RDD family